MKKRKNRIYRISLGISALLSLSSAVFVARPAAAAQVITVGESGHTEKTAGPHQRKKEPVEPERFVLPEEERFWLWWKEQMAAIAGYMPTKRKYRITPNGLCGSILLAF